MVGDTVKNIGSKNRFAVRIQKPFMIKEATQILITEYLPIESKYISHWEPHYKGEIKELGSYGHDEDEICSCRMLLTEKRIHLI